MNCVIQKSSCVKDSESNKKQQSNKSTLLWTLVGLRMINVFFVKTWFVPDEYWQSLEVAHSLTYGYGYLTWEWVVGLRSYLYPLMFSVLYKFQNVLGLDRYAFFLTVSPRLFQAVISAFSDWCFYLCIDVVFNERLAKLSLYCLLCSWFWLYCATRTLINTFEMNLVCIGLTLYCMHVKRSRKKPIYLNLLASIAAVAFFVRPTSVTIWLPLFLCYLLRLFKKSCLLTVIQKATNILLIAFSVVSILALIDKFCYGKWISVHLNFFVFNVINDQGTFYGEHPWYWYIFPGTPVVVFSQLPLSIVGFYKTKCFVSKNNFSALQNHVLNIFTLAIMTTLIMYSIPGHKEFRFILPLLPFTSFFSGFFLSCLESKHLKYAKLFLLFTNIPMVLYMGLIHQSAPSALLNKLQSEVSTVNDDILFLMPCHSTPFYSHLHKNISMRFLTCEPNLNLVEKYQDESDIFYDDPMAWFNREYFKESKQKCPGELPKLLVLFDTLHDELNSVLSDCYNTVFKTFHTHFPDKRIGKMALILQKK